MAILFKKTLVILFLLSHVIASSSSKKKQGPIKSARKSPKASLKAVSEMNMKLRERKKPSPLGLTDLRLSDSSAGTEVHDREAYEMAVENDHFDANFVLENDDENLELSDFNFNFDDEDEINFESGFGNFNFGFDGSEKSIAIALNDFEHGEILNYDADPEVGPSSSQLPLIEQTAEQVEMYRLSYLLEAIRLGDLESVKNILEAGVDVNSLEKGPLTPFMQAILSKNNEIISLMFSFGKVDPNIFSLEGKDLISMTVENLGVNAAVCILRGPIQLRPLRALTILSSLKNMPLIKDVALAFKNSEDINVIGSLIVSAKDSVVGNDLEMITYLHSLGLPMTVNYRGANFIHFAAGNNLIDMVNLLIELGTPVDIKSKATNVSALQIAFILKNYPMATALLQRGAVIGLSEFVTDAMLTNNVDLFHNLLIYYCYRIKDFVFADGHNLTTWAVALDRPRILQMLIDLNLISSDSLGRNIYNMKIPESHSQELKNVVSQERKLKQAFDNLD